MAAFIDFYPAIRASTKDCPLGLATYHLRQAAIDFCARTWFWQVDLALVDSIAGQAEYSFVQPTDGIVHKIIHARFSGQKMPDINVDQLEEIYQNWESQSGAVPQYITQKSPDKYILVPKPDAVVTGAIYIKVVVKPSQTAATLPNNLMEEYKSIIIAGALARIKGEKEKPWTDVSGAKKSELIYQQAVGPAKTRAQKGFTRANRRVKAHYF